MSYIYKYITRKNAKGKWANNAKYIWIRMTTKTKSRFHRIGILRDKPFTKAKNVFGFFTILFGLIFSNIYGKNIVFYIYIMWYVCACVMYYNIKWFLFCCIEREFTWKNIVSMSNIIKRAFQMLTLQHDFSLQMFIEFLRLGFSVSLNIYTPLNFLKL